MKAKRPPSYSVTPGATHGLPTTYAHGCRCDICRRAWTEYRRDKVREYRQRKAREKKLAEAHALIAEEERRLAREAKKRGR